MLPDLRSLRSRLTGPSPRRAWWLRHGLFAVVALLVFWLLFRVGWDNYIAGSHRNKFLHAVLKVAPAVEMVVLGNSHANCIMPKLISLPTVGLNFNGADVFAAEYQMRCLSDRLPRLKVALISISPFSFAWDNAAVVDDQGNRTQAELRRWLYATYPCWGMIPGDYVNYLEGKLWGLLSHDHWRSLLGPYIDLFPEPKPGARPAKAADQDKEADDQAEGGEVPAKPAKPRKPKRSLDSHAVKRSAILEQDLRNMLSHHPGLPQAALSSVLDLTRFLQERGVRVVFFTPPYYRKFNQVFDHRQQELTQRYMKRVVAETGAEYYDFARDPEISPDKSLFRNSDHLNILGGRIFSTRFNRVLFPSAQAPARTGQGSSPAAGRPSGS